GARHPRRDGGSVLRGDVLDGRAERRSGRLGIPGRTTGARPHLRRGPRRHAGRRGPAGPRGPDRRRPGHDEVLPRILDPPPKRGPRRPALLVPEPRGTRIEPPQTDGIPRPPPRGLERVARRPRSEDGHEPPRREERLARGTPTGDSLGPGAAGPRPDRHRLARGARGPREVQRPSEGNLPAVRVAPRPWDHQFPRHGTPGLGRRRTRAPRPVRRGVPGRRRDPSPDELGDGPHGPAPPPGLYVTLEQTAAGLLEHVAALGLKATAVSEALPILDLSRGREYLEEMVSKVGSMAETTAPRGEALLAVLKAKIFELRKKRNFRLLAID